MNKAQAFELASIVAHSDDFVTLTVRPLNAGEDIGAAIHHPNRSDYAADWGDYLVEIIEVRDGSENTVRMVIDNLGDVVHRSA